MSVEQILEERGKRYGSFESNAAVAQRIKVALQVDGTERLQDYHREALEMIAAKIARILNGDPNYVDNWADIAGYSQLVVDILTKNKNNT